MYGVTLPAVNGPLIEDVLQNVEVPLPQATILGLWISGVLSVVLLTVLLIRIRGARRLAVRNHGGGPTCKDSSKISVSDTINSPSFVITSVVLAVCVVLFIGTLIASSLPAKTNPSLAKERVGDFYGVTLPQSSGWGFPLSDAQSSNPILVQVDGQPRTCVVQTDATMYFISCKDGAESRTFLEGVAK